jgi:hypothetical protein
MNSTRRILLTALIGTALSSLASADTIGYLSNVSAGSTELNYTLTLQQFDAAAVATSIGATSVTLTGATLYFKASESTHIQLTNDSGQTQTLTTGNVHVDLTNGFTNSANGDDAYSFLLFQIWTNQHNPNSNPVLGQCPNVQPLSCSQVSVGSSGVDYGTITINDTDAAYLAANQQGTIAQAGAVVSGTGAQGLTGAKLISDNAAAYLGSGTFDLAGATVNGFGVNGGGGHLSFVQTATSASFQAEIDYSYTADFSAPGTPEPATMALVGGGLLALGLIRRRMQR